MPDDLSKKLYYDFYKHLTTLSVGSILIIVTFWESSNSTQEFAPLLIFSLGFFVLSIMCSVFTMFNVIEEHLQSFVVRLIKMSTYVFFLLGLVGLIYSAIWSDLL